MLLAINTSTLQFSLALLEHDGSIVAEYYMSRGGGHFGGLMPALSFLLSNAKSEIYELDALSVAIGPGSFTGLRVGLSAAKGLSHALDIPLIGISSLEALAAQVPYSDMPIIPVIDSRKGEFFTARFILDNNELIRKMDDVSLKLRDLSLSDNEKALFIGNDFSNQAADIKDALGPKTLLAPAFCWSLKASTVGFLGLRRFNLQDYDSPETLSPLYLRPPDIRPNKTGLKPT